jgi:hypothetical protein
MTGKTKVRKAVFSLHEKQRLENNYQMQNPMGTGMWTECPALKHIEYLEDEDKFEE